MSLLEQTTLRIVLYEGAGARAWPAQNRFDALTTLLEKGYAVTCVNGAGAVAPAGQQPLLVLGHFEGGQPSVQGLTAEVPLRVQDITGCEPAGIAATVESARLTLHSVQQGQWKPWFPVIDYDRCTNCMQCLSFCLFGVYGVDGEQKIQVQNNDNCKTNCPACSRVCPEAAIMFPKYKSGPINGDIVSDSDLNREKMKIDISALLGGDVYSMLRERSEKAKSRFSKERDSNKALQERQKCLTKLAAAGDIPAEVLMSLPSPDEIARRAVEAKAKAQAALEAQRPPG
jgi:Pyruvate/2-oxoacid:ferredoxin oxidoreductase delta subunit